MKPVLLRMLCVVLVGMAGTLPVVCDAAVSATGSDTVISDSQANASSPLDSAARDAAKRSARNDRYRRPEGHSSRNGGKKPVKNYRNHLPKAKLSIRNLSRDRDALNWIRLDARRSHGRRSRIEAYQFEIRDLLRGEQVHSPGASKHAVANVLLSPGRYEVALKVTDDRGKSKVKTRKFKIKGRPQPSFEPFRVQWAFGKNWRIGDSSFTVATPGGPITYGDITELFDASSPSDSSGPMPLGDTSTSDGTTSGCGSILTETSNGYKIASGALSFIPGAGPLFGISGQIMGMYGSKEASACVQAQISEINEQLAYQENQIQQIDEYLALGEFSFFELYVQVGADNVLSEAATYYTQQQQMADGCSGYYITFLTDAGMWNEDKCLAFLDVDVPSLAQEIAPYICNDSTMAQCDPSQPTACGSMPFRCITDPSFESPFDKLKILYDAAPSFSIVTSLAGTDPTAIASGCAGGTACWKLVAPPPPSKTADSTLLALYDALWGEAVALVRAQTEGESGLSGEAGNIVSQQYEAYNQSLASFYQRSLTVLNQAFFMEYEINQFNYYHAHNQEGGRNGTYIEGQNIASWGKVPGTLYEYRSTDFVSAQDDLMQYNEAQKQLALLYAARVNQLYLNTLNWVISDAPVGPQSYPAPPSSQADEWPFAGNLQVAIPFESAVGASLKTSTSQTEWNTPIGQVLAPSSTEATDAAWTSNSILYQFSMQNPYKCNEALAKYNAEQEDQGSSGFLASALGTPADCPPIFALPDGSPLNQSFFDGKTLQPYSYSVSAGGTDACPDECQTCTSGLTYTCGGETGNSACDPTVPDSCSPPSSCLPVTGGGLGLAIEIPDSWQVITSGSGSNGSWSESCDTDGAVISGAANSLSDPPRLCASCNSESAAALWSCATCPSGMWTNTDGTLTCVDPTYACRGFCSTSTDECGDYRFAEPESTTANRCTLCGGASVLALSAPMPSNFHLCESPAQLAYFEVPYSYSGNNAGLIPGTAVLSCGSWDNPETFSNTSPAVPVANDDSVLASVWETPELYSTQHGTEWDCGTGAVQFQPSIPCETGTTDRLSDTPSAGECDFVGFDQVGINTGDSAVLNFMFTPPNNLTGSTMGGAAIPLSLVFQCSACQSQSQDTFGRNEPINNFMYGCTNLIAGLPPSAASSDQATQIATDGYACELTSQIDDERTTPQTLSCSSVDGREYLLGLVYSDSSTDSGLSSGVSLVSKQANLGCPTACYQCDSGAGGETSGGRELVTGTDGDLVCDGYCSGWNYCGNSNFNLANGMTPPVDCTSCGGGDFVLDEPTLCAASDFDTCACDGTVYYGKKFVNSLKVNGSAQPGGGTDLSGDITTFSEMIADATYYNTSPLSNGLVQCAPDYFGGDPALDFYKHCYCSN